MDVNYILITFVKHLLYIMKERILEFLKTENKTSAQFAEEIGVQPSGISHIISGRNKPSLDFILKMLEKYAYISTDWLLFGRGSMFKEPQMADLFSGQDLEKPEISTENGLKEQDSQFPESNPDLIINDKISEKPVHLVPQVSKIVWFFENNTFKEYYPYKGL